jgi:hypothetical protein
VVAEKGGCKVLNGVKRALMKRRLIVGLLHAHIKSGDNFTAHLVLTRNEDATLETEMVYGETGDFIHKVVRFLGFRL